MGYSDAPPQPRRSRDVPAELNALLRNARVDGPYVLAGHSLGGLYARLYQSLHPDEVAGLVLVDAGHEEQFRRIPELRELFAIQARSVRVGAYLAQFGVVRALDAYQNRSLELYRPGSLDRPATERFSIKLRPRAFREAYREMSAAEEISGEVRRTRRSLDMPLMVLTHGKDPLPGIDAARMLEIESTWRELQGDLARLSPQGVHLIAEKSGHYIQEQQPDMVIDAIRTVVDRARSHREKAVPASHPSAEPTAVSPQ